MGYGGIGGGGGGGTSDISKVVDSFTIISLRAQATSGVSEGDVVYVAGKGFYAWDPASTETDDGDKVVKAADAATGRWKLVEDTSRGDNVLTPTITSPSSGSTNITPKPTITTNAYQSDRGNAQASMQIQIATNSDFSTIICDQSSSVAGVSIEVSETSGTLRPGLLDDNTLYFARARHKDSAGDFSFYSDKVSFTTGEFPTKFVAVNSGNWNSASTWGLSGSTEGLHYPPSWGGINCYVNKDVYLTIPEGVTASCASLRVGITNLSSQDTRLYVSGTLNISGSVSEYIPGGHTTKASFDGSGTLAIGSTQISLNTSYSVGEILILDCDDHRYAEPVKIESIASSGGGVYTYNLLTSGSNGIGGTWSATTIAHDKSTARVRKNADSPEFSQYGLFASGRKAEMHFCSGSVTNLHGSQWLRQIAGGSTRIYYYFKGTPNKRVTFKGDTTVPTDFQYDQTVSVDVGSGWYDHRWDIQYTDFSNFADLHFSGLEAYITGDHKACWRSTFTDCHIASGFSSWKSGMRTWIGNRFVRMKDNNSTSGLTGDGGNPKEVFRSGGYNSDSITSDTIKDRVQQKNLFHRQEGFSGYLLLDEQYSSTDNVWINVKNYLNAPVLQEKNFYFYSLDTAGSLYLGYASGSLTSSLQDSVWIGGSNNPWMLHFADDSTAADGERRYQRNYCQTYNPDQTDGGDVFSGNAANKNIRANNIVRMIGHDNPIILKTAAAANHIIQNETNVSPSASYYSAPTYYSLLISNYNVGIAITGDGNKVIDNLLYDVSTQSPGTARTAIKLYSGNDQLDEVRNNHFHGLTGGDTHPVSAVSSSGEKPYINLASSLDSSTLKADAASGSSTFIIDDSNGALWGGSGLNYPFYVVIDRDNAGEQLVRVASHALVGSDHTITLYSGEVLSKIHSASVTVDYAYGHADTTGDPRFADPYRDIESFVAGVLRNDNIFTYDFSDGTSSDVSDLDPDTDDKRTIARKVLQDELFKYNLSTYDPRYDEKNVLEWMRSGFTPQNPTVWSGSTEGSYRGAVDPGTIAWSNANSLYLDGINDYITVSDASSLDVTQMCMMMYVRIPNGSTKSGRLYSKQGSYGILIQDGKPAFEITADSLVDAPQSQGDTSINDNKWHHIAVTYDGSNAILYLDGKTEKSVTLTGNIVNSSNALLVGQNGSGVTCNVAQLALMNDDWSYDQLLEYVRPVETTHKGLYYFNGNANDATSNNHNGTATSVTYTTGMKMDKAANFDGTNSFISLPSGSSELRFLAGKGDIDKKFTICCRVKPSVTTEQYILDLGGSEVGLRIDANKRFRGFYFNSDDVEKFCVSDNEVVADTEYHVTFVCDGGEANLYIDGEEQSTYESGSVSYGRILSHTDTIDTNGSPACRIGSPASSTSNRFKGLIELLEIHDDALSPWEIKRKAKNKIIPTDLAKHSAFSECVHFFDFADEPMILASNSVKDKSGDNNNGTPVNMASEPQDRFDAPGWFDKD